MSKDEMVMVKEVEMKKSHYDAMIAYAKLHKTMPRNEFWSSVTREEFWQDMTKDEKAVAFDIPKVVEISKKNGFYDDIEEADFIKLRTKNIERGEEKVAKKKGVTHMEETKKDKPVDAKDASPVKPADGEVYLFSQRKTVDLGMPVDIKIGTGPAESITELVSNEKELEEARKVILEGLEEYEKNPDMMAFAAKMVDACPELFTKHLKDSDFLKDTSIGTVLLAIDDLKGSGKKVNREALDLMEKILVTIADTATKIADTKDMSDDEKKEREMLGGVSAKEVVKLIKAIGDDKKSKEYFQEILGDSIKVDELEDLVEAMETSGILKGDTIDMKDIAKDIEDVIKSCKTLSETVGKLPAFGHTHEGPFNRMVRASRASIMRLCS